MSSKKSTNESGTFLCNTSCICGDSSDAMSVYCKTDEKGEKTIDAYCRSGFCDRDNPYITSTELDEAGVDLTTIDTRRLAQEGLPVDFTEIEALPFRGWKERRITKSISEKYGVHTLIDTDGETVLKRCYPETRDGQRVGYSIRLTQPNKDFYKKGSCKATNELFGQSLFQAGGKYVVITTGQEDALAMAQVLQYDKAGVSYFTPCLSVTCGDGSTIQQIRSNFKYLNSFEKIVLLFDEDESGQKYVKEAAGLFSPGKAHIGKLPGNCKDVCDALKAGLGGELKQSFWKAERYSPASIVGSGSTWDALIQRANFEKVSLPPFAKQLQDMLNGGPAMGEITTIASASSTGKSTICNEFLYHWIMSTNYKVGIVPLESDLGELTENLLSIHIGKKLANMDDDEKKAFYATDDAKEHHRNFTQLPDGSDRFLIVDHNGDVSDDRLKDQLEYLVASGCKITILDPLTLALSGQGNVGMDEFMSWLLRLVKSRMIHHVNVCHVRKNANGSQANSRGAEISEESISGAGSQFQIAMNIILLMRDKISDNPIIRNTTKAVLSKARRTGKTGCAGYWLYNNDTGKLEVGRSIEEIEEMGDYSEDENLFDKMGANNDTDPNSLLSGHQKVEDKF